MSDPGRIDVSVPPGVRAAFTLRHGGVSTGTHASANLGYGTGDAPGAVRANRQALCAALGISPDAVTMGTQVHGAAVDDIAGPSAGAFLDDSPAVWPERDGMVSSQPDVALMVVTADCVPVLLWSLDGTRVGAVHAGWRGIVGGVLREAVSKFSTAGLIGAAIGPCAGACCYQVDADLRGEFRARFGDTCVVDDRVDLPAAVKTALVASGVDAEHVQVDGSCTVCDDDRFFSYRRDGARTGRTGAIIWMESR